MGLEPLKEAYKVSTPKHRAAPSASYFVTTKCWQGRAIFQVRENAEVLLECLFRYRERGAYLLHEFVLMPDHLHMLLTPGTATSLEKAIQLIKGGSSYEIHKRRGAKVEIWQQGFYDWTIRDAADWRAKAKYIGMNPVRARLVKEFRHWPYSSASGRFVLDPMPERLAKLSSGAEALVSRSQTRGLKPPPPSKLSSGAKAPIPSVPSTQGLKPLPPKEHAS